LRYFRSPVSADASIIGGLKTSVKMSAVVTVRVTATAYVHGSILWADGGMGAAIRPDAF